MKSVLASLKPYYYYLVGEGIKKIEVRKSQPKADDWNKETYFYMSKDEKSFAMIPKEFQEKYRKHFGKVGLKFVCDKIYDITPHCDIPTFVNQYECDWKYGEAEHCLSFDELKAYLNTKNGYGWHITDLVIYDEPKELSEFEHDCNGMCIDFKKGIACEKVGFTCNGLLPLTRPFMSWGYVEGVGV